MIRNLVVVMCFAILGACATDVLQGYIGKPITEAILDNGPPTNIVELGDNRRAYQWDVTKAGIVPITAPSTTYVYGSGISATATITSTTYVPYEQRCIYTVTATKSESGEYIVDGFREPEFGCL